MRLSRRLRIPLIVALTILFLVLFLRKSDPRHVLAIIESVNPWWLALAFAGNVGALVFRSLRWRTILDPDNPPPAYATFFATAVGYMLSMVLPVRAADVTRPALLSRRTRHRFSTALGTVLTERVLDLTSMLSLFLVYIFTAGRKIAADPATATQAHVLSFAGGFALAIVVVMTTFMVSLYFFSASVRRAHAFLGRFLPRRAREGWMRFFDSFVQSIQVVRNWRAFGEILFYTACIWGCLCSQFYFVLLAFHRPLPFAVSFFVTGFAIVGLVIPTPAGVGGYHKATQVALTSFYHFDVNTSVAVAFVFHIVGVAPVILIGLALFAHAGLSWKTVSKIAEERPSEALEELDQIGETGQE